MPDDSAAHQSRSLPSNQEDREVYLREHNAAKFIAAVNSVQTEQLGTLMMMLDAFVGEPDVLYIALDYVRNEGVTVTIAPPLPTQHHDWQVA